jgi:xanthine dehydrogenase accessory factor
MLLAREPDAAERFAAAYPDNVVPDLAAWMRGGQRCALVTLVGVDGSAPRAKGAQMAVSESGTWAGYISGGCLEQAIALEAVAAIKARKPRLLRYGKGSPYVDIRLPCGSGLDVFVQPVFEAGPIYAISRELQRRRPTALRIDLATGDARLEAAPREAAHMQSHREGQTFLRAYAPALRCLIAGPSPIAAALADLAVCAGFEVELHAPDLEALPRLPRAVKLRELAPRLPTFQPDPWTAAILAFHDHDQELPAFSALLRSPCFYIGAIGSRNAHAVRKLALIEAGFGQAEVARIVSPAGLLAGLKTAPFAALSILAQIVAAAREQRIVS